jgi:hypothetical protein
LLTHRERILATLQHQRADRVALLGGWVIDDGLQRALAGCSEEEYWRHPARWAIEAERRLGVDGMVAVITPPNPGDYRLGLTREAFESYRQRYRSPEDVLAFVRTLPAPDEAARQFDARRWREDLRAEIVTLQELMGDIVYLPTFWEVVHPRFEWYNDFGYENYLMFMQLYPEEAGRLFASEVEVNRKKGLAVLDLYKEMDMIPLTLIGTDITGRSGPVISPALLREFYFPHVRRALDPLLEAGVRMVWHSDGYIHPIADDILSCGVSGLQGFQIECGVDLADIARRRTISGQQLTIFAGPSTAATLPHGSIEDVRREVEQIIDAFAEQSALFVLPANNVLPDCPVENVIEMYRWAAEYGRRAAG